VYQYPNLHAVLFGINRFLSMRFASCWSTPAMYFGRPILCTIVQPEFSGISVRCTPTPRAPTRSCLRISDLPTAGPSGLPIRRYTARITCYPISRQALASDQLRAADLPGDGPNKRYSDNNTNDSTSRMGCLIADAGSFAQNYRFTCPQMPLLSLSPRCAENKKKESARISPFLGSIGWLPGSIAITPVN